MIDKIKALCAENSMSLQDLERETGLGVNTIYKWGNAYPSVDKLQKVADYFAVSVDYLLGREDGETDDTMLLREQLRRQPGMRMLFDAAKGVTAEQLEAVSKMIETWKQ